MPFAMVTGASSGLGREFATQLAQRSTDLVVVARDTQALELLATELRQRYGVAVEVLAADLTVDDDVERVAARLRDRAWPVDLLVNNAGYGLPLDFAGNEIAVERAHLRIHVDTPMRLIHAALEQMRGRGGRIVNVASVAAFVPRATYSAAKAWIVNFSRWASVAYAADRVTVTALCPGFTHTSFHERLGLAPGEEGVSPLLWLGASQVVREGLRDAARGRAVSVPSFRYKALVLLTRVLPASWLAAAARRGRD